MWKRITDCFACRRQGYERGKGDGSEKAQSEESDKHLPTNQPGEESTGRDDDVLIKPEEDKLSKEAPKAEEESVIEEDEPVEEEDLKAGESREADVEVNYQNKDDEQLIKDEHEISKESDAIQVKVDTTVQEVAKSATVVENETTSPLEKENEGQTNIAATLAETKSGESCMECSSEAPQAKYAKSEEDSGPENTSRASDVVLNEAVHNILGALDDILLKERNTNTEIKTVDISGLSEPAPAIPNTEGGLSPSKIPEIVVTEAGVDAVKESGLENNLSVDQEAVPVMSSAGGNDVLSDEYKLNDSSINGSPPEEIPREEIKKSSCVPTQQAEKKGKRRSLVLVEQFSEQLSTSVVDAVLHKPEIGHVVSNSELCKFSGILAESIVKTVLDYSKTNQDQIVESDENSNNVPINVECMDNEADNRIQDVSLADLIKDETANVEGDEYEASFMSLDEYAKKLSEQILAKVLNEQEFNGQYAEQEYPSAEVYISRLTETVISNAINSVNDHGTKSSSITMDDDPKCIDSLVSELVQNVLESAISRMADQMGEKVTGGDEEGYQNGHVDNRRSNGVDMVATNGKLQSKWLSEDDLDELYEDDLSDDDNIKVEHVSDTKAEDSPLNSGNADNLSDDGGDSDLDNLDTVNTNSLTNGEQNNAEEAPNFLRPRNGTSNRDEMSVWRRSLIEDLDEDLEFDEEDSPCGSPTKPDNFDTLLVAGSSDEEECTTPTAKVPPAPVKTSHSTSSRSRIRSVDSSPALVFDNGSGWLKVGYSNDSTPKEIIPSVVGIPLRYSQDISGIEYSSRPGLVFGDMAVGKAGVLHNDYPLKADVIEKWGDIEGLWNYVLSSLMSVPEHPEFPVLLTQPALNPKKNTEKLAEIMFEKFHVPSLFIANQPALALFSMGYTSGLSFCSGFNNTQAGVVYEGHMLPYTVRQLDIAGYQLTETLKKLLMSGQGFGFRTSSQWKIVNDIKKKMAFVSADFETDVKNYKTQAQLHEPYELPDGQVIEIGSERFGCAEILFRPQELGLTQPPAHLLIADAIQSCDEELHDMCYKAIGISGGTTLMKGFPERLENELRKYDRKFKNFIIPEHRDLSTWLGGSIFASLPTFREMVVDVDEYADVGAKVVHSKCF